MAVLIRIAQKTAIKKFVHDVYQNGGKLTPLSLRVAASAIDDLFWYRDNDAPEGQKSLWDCIIDCSFLLGGDINAAKTKIKYPEDVSSFMQPFSNLSDFENSDYNENTGINNNAETKALTLHTRGAHLDIMNIHASVFCKRTIYDTTLSFNGSLSSLRISYAELLGNRHSDRSMEIILSYGRTGAVGSYYFGNESQFSGNTVWPLQTDGFKLINSQNTFHRLFENGTVKQLEYQQTSTLVNSEIRLFSAGGDIFPGIISAYSLGKGLTVLQEKQMFHVFSKVQQRLGRQI